MTDFVRAQQSILVQGVELHKIPISLKKGPSQLKTHELKVGNTDKHGRENKQMTHAYQYFDLQPRGEIEIATRR